MADPVLELYDTTLRDGAQMVGLSLSVEDKLKILHALDALGVPLVEGGWPGANPKDTEFFRLAARERLEGAVLTSFGMCRRPGERPEDSAVLRALLDAGTEVVCLVGKTSSVHVTETLHAAPAEGVAMIADSVRFLRREGRRVFFDAEHFFDGFAEDSAYALACLRAAEEAGAERLVLCDTNGGTLPSEVARVVASAASDVETPLGVHCHDDAGVAVANSLAQPGAEDGTAGPAAGVAGLAHGDLALRRRDREPASRRPAALRGAERVLAQGRAAHVGAGPPSGRVRARAPGRRGESGSDGGVGARGPRLAPTEARRAGDRPRTR
jgi:hypothetical protein